MKNYNTFYGNLSKEKFIEKCEFEIRTCKLLLEARQKALEALSSYRGKAVNKRLCDAVEVALYEAGIAVYPFWKKITTILGARYAIALHPKEDARYYNGFYTNNSLEIIIRERGGRYNEVDTFDDDRNQNNLRNFAKRIEQHNDAIENYDKWAERTESLRTQIREYRATFNWILCADLSTTLCY